jgi:hypothetical protein
VVAATPALQVTVVQGRNVSKAALAASPKLAREVLAWTATRRREMDGWTHARPGLAGLQRRSGGEK